MRGKSLERSKGSTLGLNWTLPSNHQSLDDSILRSFEVKSNVPIDFFKSWEKFLEPDSLQQLTHFKPNPNQPNQTENFQHSIPKNPKNHNPKNHKTKQKRDKPKLRRIRSRSLCEIKPGQPVPFSITNQLLKNVVPPPTIPPTCPKSTQLELPSTKTTTFDNILDSSITDSGKH